MKVLGDKGTRNKPLPLVNGSEGKLLCRTETWSQAGADAIYVFVVSNDALRLCLTSQLSLKQATKLGGILAIASARFKSYIYQYIL